MTFAEMQQLFFQRIDQSGSPDFNAVETDRLLNYGYEVFYSINRPKFDMNQAQSVNLTHLLRPFTLTGISVIRVVGVGADIVDYRDLSRMIAIFDKKDCNGVIGEATRNVVPMPIASRDINADDPHNKPTNDFPFYIQDNDGLFRTITILSTTTPKRLEGHYFKTLQIIDGAGNPNTDFEGQDYIARQVVELAKVIAKGDLDDYPAVKNALNESGMLLGITV